MKTDEAQLIDACIKRDERACRQLYERFAPKMFGICLRYTRSTTAAEDVLHDGFIKVFENLDKLRAVEALDAWISKIMVHTAINSLRNEQPLVSYGNIEENAENEYGSSDSVYAKIDAEIVIKAMQELPDAYRTVLNLCEVEGYGYGEVAKMMKIKESTVRSNLVRAKRLMCNKLRNEYKDLIYNI